MTHSQMNRTQTEPNELSCRHILMLAAVRVAWHLNFASASCTVACCVLLQRAVWRCRVRTSTSAPWPLARCLVSWLFCTTASGRPPSRVSVALVNVTISALHRYVVCDVRGAFNNSSTRLRKKQLITKKYFLFLNVVPQ